MFTLFAFIAVTMAAEYVQIEYNKGSYEISEFNKCYCYKDDKCYMYEKSADNKKILEYVYANAQNCDGTKPTPEEYTIGEKKDGFTYKLVDKLPEHKFHYFESEKTDCTDKDTRAKVLVAEDNCELDFYSGNLYNKYTLNENKVKMAEFTDSNCQTATKVDGTEEIKSQLDVNTCTQIEGEGDYGKFIPGAYAPKKQYVSIEYNSGSYEISELGKCYCYKDDYCYFYEINALGTKIIEKVYPADSNCDPTAVSGTVEPNEYEIGDGTYNGLKYNIIDTLPEHSFYYYESMATDCSDKDSRAKVLLAENNCELDFYSGYLYNKYTLDGDKVKMAEYLDDQCTQISGIEGTEQIASEVNVNECVSIEGENGAKGKFIPGAYAVTQGEDYFFIVHNFGAFDIFELGQCYCFPDDGCYKYEKVTGDGSKAKKNYYEGATDCSGTSETTLWPIFTRFYETDEMFVISSSIPPTKFHYIASSTENCDESANMPVKLYSDSNCERDPYSKKKIYRKYTLTGEAGSQKIEIKQYKDDQCTIPMNKPTDVQKVTEHDINTCIDIEGKTSQFSAEKYQLAAAEGTPASEYLGITYNKDSIELYEFGKCYCFAEDSCYKYVKNADNVHVDEYTYPLDSKCEVATEPEPTQYKLDGTTVYDKDMTFKAYTYAQIPAHTFHYIVSATGDCEDVMPVPVEVFTATNCERDFYDEEDDKVYRKYTLSGTAPNQKIDIAQFSDNTCATTKKEQVPKVTEYEADKCLDVDGGKVQFSSAKYTLPTPPSPPQNNGSAFTMLLVALMVVFFLF